MENTKLSRGIRNNNPGNIKHNPANKWHGVADKQDDKVFVQFKTMAHGVRAIAVILQTYYDRYKIDTIEAICEKWAPRGVDNNNTDDHIAAVRQEAKAYAGQHFNLHTYKDLEPIVRGIIRAENKPDGLLQVGQANIDAGLKMIGLYPNKSLAKEDVTKGAAIAVTGGALQVVAEIANQLSPAVTLFERVAGYFPYLGAALLIVGLGYIIYSKIKERKRY